MNLWYVIIPIIVGGVWCDVETVRSVGSSSGELVRYIMTTYQPLEKITTFVNAFRERL
jgi:hypothetical protein